MQEPRIQYANKCKKEDTWQKSYNFSAAAVRKVFFIFIFSIGIWEFKAKPTSSEINCNITDAEKMYEKSIKKIKVQDYVLEHLLWREL